MFANGGVGEDGLAGRKPEKRIEGQRRRQRGRDLNVELNVDLDLEFGSSSQSRKSLGSTRGNFEILLVAFWC